MHDVKYIFFFFFHLSGYVQLPVSALACMAAEEQVSFLLLSRSLQRRLCACEWQENDLCSADFSPARALPQEEGLAASREKKLTRGRGCR